MTSAPTDGMVLAVLRGEDAPPAAPTDAEAVRLWMEAEGLRAGTGRTLLTPLWERYCAWMEGRGLLPMPLRRFGALLPLPRRGGKVCVACDQAPRTLPRRQRRHPTLRGGWRRTLPKHPAPRGRPCVDPMGRVFPSLSVAARWHRVMPSALHKTADGVCLFRGLSVRLLTRAEAALIPRGTAAGARVQGVGWAPPP